jgi:hypothetical protein
LYAKVNAMQKSFLLVMTIATLLLAACGPIAAPQAVTAEAPSTESLATADLSATKTYSLAQVEQLTVSAAALQAAADQYFALAEAAGFDYAALWANQPAEVSGALLAAKDAWIAASPQYEQMEGIVAGVPSLADYDVILDAGASGEEDPENAVPFDLTLPDGRVLPKPGNLFGVTESALWGTEPTYVIADVQPDLDGSGAIDFGEALPDANVLKAGADALASYTAKLSQAAQAWQPTDAAAPAVAQQTALHKRAAH